MNKQKNARPEPKAEASGVEHLDASEAFDVAASAHRVNRTRRVVRERAATLVAQKKSIRSLFIPLCVSAGLLSILVFAIWTLLDQYEANPNGLPDASQQILVLLLWCLPLTGASLAIVWFRKSSEKTPYRGER